MNNVKQLKKYCHGMSVAPPPPPRTPTQLLSTTLNIYFMENWGALKTNNYLKNPIVICDNGLLEKSQLRCLKLNFNLFQKLIITNHIM
jgi:hypothetical protein